MGAYAQKWQQRLSEADPDDPNAPDAERPLDESPNAAELPDAKPMEPKKLDAVAKKLAKAAGEDNPPPHPHTEAPAAPLPETFKETRPFKNTGPDLAGQLNSQAAAVPMQVAKNASPIDSAASGIVSGATLGHSDEIQGAVSRGLDYVQGKDGKSYDQYRNEARAVNAATRAANPKAATAGNIAGTVATTALAPAAKGLLGAVGTGAATGAVAGSGYSDADLGSRDFVRDVARGTVTGGAMGAAGYGLSKYALGAPDKVQKAADRDILGSATGKARKALVEENGAVKPEIRDLHANTPDLRAANKSRDFGKMIDLSKQHLAELSPQRDAIYEAYASKVGGGGNAEAATGQDLLSTQQLPRETMRDIVPPKPMGGVDLAAIKASKAGAVEPVEDLTATQRIPTGTPTAPKLPPPSGSAYDPAQIAKLADIADRHAAEASARAGEFAKQPQWASLANKAETEAAQFKAKSVRLRDESRKVLESQERGPPKGIPASSEIVNPKLVAPPPPEIPDALASTALKQLQTLRDHAAKPISQGGTGAEKAYIAKLDDIIERVGPGGKVDAAKLREFMSNQVGVKPGEKNIAPRAADAQNDAYFTLRDKVLHPEIKRVLGDKAVADLKRIDGQITSWKRVQDAAKAQAIAPAAAKEVTKPITGAPGRALNAVGKVAQEGARKALATEPVQALAKGIKNTPGALPGIEASPSDTSSHPIREAMDVLKNGIKGARSAYDYLFGPRGQSAAGYDPNRPGGP